MPLWCSAAVSVLLSAPCRTYLTAANALPTPVGPNSLKQAISVEACAQGLNLVNARLRPKQGGLFVVRTLGLLTAAVAGAIAMSTAAPALATPVPQAPYPNCTVAKENGDCDIPSTSDLYQAKLDRDQDGLGCEC
jgi:hypothetical protein